METRQTSGISGSIRMFMGGRARTIAIVGLAHCLTYAPSSHADDLKTRRSRAVTEVAPIFLNKEISIEAKLVSADGPEYWEKLFGKKVYGCPALPATEATESLNLQLSTGRAGQWAGDLDGVNTTTTKPTGAVGGGFAVPSNSTARIPGTQTGPEFEFSFDGTVNVRRALIDAAAEEFDRCARKLPFGTYKGDELTRLCPLPPINRERVSQTCVPVVSGKIGPRAANGSGFKVSMYQQTLCDLVGYGRPNDANTGFISCFFQYYEGVATITNGPLAEETRALKSSATKAHRTCGKSRRGSSPRSIAACVRKSMSKSMSLRVM